MPGCVRRTSTSRKNSSTISAWCTSRARRARSTMRGTDPFHHIHVTEKGDPGFLGMAWHAKSEDDLKALAKVPGASGVEHIDEPGGGMRVRLKEPNGYTIEVVYGMEQVLPIQANRQTSTPARSRSIAPASSCASARARRRVKRIAHGVLGTPKNIETVKWFRDMLGLVCSDDVYAGTKENVIGSFNRCDNGDEYVDHHAFFCMKHETRRPQPLLVRGAGHRRRVHGPRISRRQEEVRAHVGHRPPSARQPGL